MLRRLIASLRGASQRRPRAPAVGAAALAEAGAAAWRRGDLVAAERHLRAALAADPGWAAAHGNLGMVLWQRRAFDEGFACLERAVALDPDDLGQRINLANALMVGNRMTDAIAEYREVLRRHPGHPRACANLAKPLLDVCDWDGAQGFSSELVDRWQADDPNANRSMTPFASLLYDLPQAFRRDIARAYARGVEERVAGLPRTPAAPSGGGRIRVGYLSADLHDHATAQLAVGMFEHHDRDRFEVHAYSLGADDHSAYRRRVAAAFEHFHDLGEAAPEAIAAQIAADRIEVLVDVNGYTRGGRPEIAAMRPAPVQASWLGYPGTMGAAFIDYLIADRTVIPDEVADGYDERVVRLPNAYQANDDRQPIDPATPSREALGLPREGIVFACFNSHHKIERGTFAAWLRVLHAVPGSVLWLLDGHGAPALRHAAGEAGIDPARLVFAGKLPKAAHLARHRAADLFLDTRTYNAHTTASDALWSGLPLLTLRGDAFAGRVAASLLYALGFPELVAHDASDYERRAIALAREPVSLADLRLRIEAARGRAALFDTARFTRDIEHAYAEMAARLRAGHAPTAFDVAGGRPRA